MHASDPTAVVGPSADDVPVDPYHAWADLTGWEGFGGPPESFPVAMELQAGKTAQHLLRATDGLPPRDCRVPPVYWVGRYQSQRFVTAQVSPQFMQRWQRGSFLRETVLRIELGLPVVGALRDRLVVPQLDSDPKPPLFGIIDHGFAFAGPDFVRPGPGGVKVSRVLSLWDQEDKTPAFDTTPPDGAIVPPLFGFGRELRQSELTALLSKHAGDEAACYEAAGYRALRRAATHGTHVASLAIGRMPPSHRLRFGQSSNRPPASPDPAADVDMVLVQLPRDAVQDASGRWLSVHVLNGLRHILSVAKSQQAVVVNLSYGARTGPHDGTGVTEMAMLALLDQHNAVDSGLGRLDIVLAAGNAFDQRSHAVVRLDPEAPSAATLRWQVAAGSEAWTFCEVWVPEGVTPGDLQIQLQAPGGPAATALQASGGQYSLLSDAAGRIVAALIFPKVTSLGLHGTCALLAVAPTWRRGGGSRAPSGRWTIEAQWMGDKEPPPFTLHAYLARNDADFGMPVRGRLSHFVGGANYDPERHLRRARDDATVPTSPVRRRGTLSWNAEADGLHVVAGIVDRPYAPQNQARAKQLHAAYSSAGPARKPGTRKGPDVALPSDASPNSPGVRAAATRGAATVRLVGTSAAAPAWARVLLNGGGRPTQPGPPERPKPNEPDPDAPMFGGNPREAP